VKPALRLGFPCRKASKDPQKTTALIGRAWKQCKLWSEPVLIGREAWPYHSILFVVCLLFVTHLWYRFPGGFSGGVTPDPIPNSEVKPTRADGTDRASDRESRSLPGFFIFS
jgi:hypothetical protein